MLSLVSHGQVPDSKILVYAFVLACSLRLLHNSYAVSSGVPTRLQSIIISSNTLLLSWYASDVENTNGILRQYHVEITDRISTDQTVYTTNETHLLVDNLQPNHEYTFRVAALTKFNVRGQFSKAISVTLQGKVVWRNIVKINSTNFSCPAHFRHGMVTKLLLFLDTIIYY